MAFRRMALLTRAFKTSAICAALLAASSPAWSEDQITAPAGAPPTLESLLQQKVPAPLQGQVDQNAAAAAASSTSAPFQMAEPTIPIAPVAPPPVVKKKRHLEAGIQEQSLNGDADQNAGDLAGMSPQMDKGNPLNANANSSTLDSGVTSSDPDMDDQEMMVQWDKWHNRVLNAIQQGLIEQLTATGDNLMFMDRRTGQMRSKYPLGTMAMFSCQVTPDHRVINLKIEQTSGFADYDRAVYQSVSVLNGSSVLRYPKGSHRKVVSEAAGIRTSMQAGPANFHWGDTEHYRVPGN